MRLGSSYSEAVRNTIDIVEPGGDQINLQNGRIIKPKRKQTLDICAGYTGWMRCQRSDIVQHCPISSVKIALYDNRCVMPRLILRLRLPDAETLRADSIQ